MNRSPLVAVAAALFVTLSCRDATPVTEPELEPHALLFGGGGGGGGGLLACPPQASVSTTTVVGPAGGRIEVGPHVLDIPAGALDHAVTITATAPSASVVRLDLEPHGLAFDTRAVLTLSYAHCGLIYSLWPKRIAYTSDALAILEYLLSWDTLFPRRVSAPLQPFSTYALPW